MHTRHFEKRHHRVKATSLAADHGCCRDAAVVEMQFPCPPTEVANLADRRTADPRRQRAALLLDHELRDADVAALALRRRGARKQMDEVGAVRKRAPGLGP